MTSRSTPYAQTFNATEHSTSRSETFFSYAPLPSTASFLGTVMKDIINEFGGRNDNWNDTPFSFIADFIPSPYYTLGIGFYPIFLCSLPLTILADAVVGIFEVAFCAINGAPEDQILDNAYRKFVISPAQQLTYLISGLAFTTLVLSGVFLPIALGVYPPLTSPIIALISGLFLTIAGTTWIVGHDIGKTAVDFLPDIFKHKDFDVFLDKPKPSASHSSYTYDSGDPFENMFREFFAGQFGEGGFSGAYAGASSTGGSYGYNTSNRSNHRWKEVLKEDYAFLGNSTEYSLTGSPLTTPTKLPNEYIAFRALVKNNGSHLELLGLGRDRTSKEVNLAYRRLARVLHPDKYKDTTAENEAKCLFQCLKSAYDIYKD